MVVLCQIDAATEKIVNIRASLGDDVLRDLREEEIVVHDERPVIDLNKQILALVVVEEIS